MIVLEFGYDGDGFEYVAHKGKDEIFVAYTRNMLYRLTEDILQGCEEPPLPPVYGKKPLGFVAVGKNGKFLAEDGSGHEIIGDLNEISIKEVTDYLMEGNLKTLEIKLKRSNKSPSRRMSGEVPSP